MKLNEENVEFIQTACNPIAVAKQLYQWSLKVCHNDGFDAVRGNLLLRSVVGKLCDMYGIEHSNNAYEYLSLREKDDV